MKRCTVRLSCILAIFGSLACGVEPEDEGLEPEDRDPLGAAEGKFEAWNAANNPASVDSTFLYYAHQLPLSGAGPDPIPGYYWPTDEDGVNGKWDGASSLSPAAKYARAFGRPDVPDRVSRANGVKAATNRKTCNSDADCAADDSTCAASYDGAVRRCIPSWWGICHGWAPYALVEPAARTPVKRQASDGTEVTFYPGDLEGLMSMVYTDVPTRFLSSRCNKDEPPTDASGRLIHGECRDMNAASWHIVTTNLMGLRSQGFVLDQTYDDEVWNQPGRDYEIVNGVGDELREITRDEALELLGTEQSVAILANDVIVRRDDVRRGTFTATRSGAHTVKLSGTGDADLFVRRGSAPTRATYDCRPYESGSHEECPVNLVAGETLHWMVSGYAAESRVSLGVSAPDGGQSGYVYNPLAQRFYHVKMDYRFVVESRPSRQSHVNQVNSYTRRKRYEYVLEADAYGKIIGGEWVGASRTDHPDFAWWPTGAPPSTVAGIRYADVKEMNDEAAGGEVGSTRVTVMEDAAVGSSGAWGSKYAVVTAEAGVRRLVVTMKGSGDADLYVRRGTSPTIYVSDCQSVTAGTSAESCSVDVPSNGGDYYVRARSRTPGTTVTIVVEKLR